MKICHITSVHQLRDVRIFVKECQSLTSQYEVHYIVPADNETEETKIIDGVHVHFIKKGNKGRLDRAMNTSKRAFEKAMEIDAAVYHFHDPELLLIGWKLRKKGKKVIYDVHEDVPRQIMSKHWIPKVCRGPISSSFESFENFISKRLNAIVTATPHIADRYSKLNRHVVNVNNYPILEEFTMTEKKRPSDKSICYVGGLSDIRGLFSMLDALQYTDAVLHLAGTFAAEKEKQAAMNHPSWAKVVFHGFVSRSEVEKLLNSASAGLVVLRPTVNYLDSLPIKMFEYMAASLPVICSDFPLWKSIVDKHQCGIYVNPEDPQAIAEAIDYITSHPEEALQMGRNGRKAVETEYNWEAESRKLLEAYGDLVSS